MAKLTFLERGPVTGVDVSSWEQKNSGCVLPEDLKALLQISDGMSLKWDAKLHGAAFVRFVDIEMCRLLAHLLLLVTDSAASSRRDHAARVHAPEQPDGYGGDPA